MDKLDFPAVEGGVVTQAHANMCAEYGHAFHLRNGVLQELCPRCGEKVHTFDGMPACGKDTDGQGRLCNDEPNHPGECTH